MRSNLEWMKRWIGEDIIDKIDKHRKKCGEIQRERQLGTLEMVWLFLGVAGNSGTNSLHEIFDQMLEEIGAKAMITVSAFCDRRKFFSQSVSISDLVRHREKSRCHSS